MTWLLTYEIAGATCRLRVESERLLEMARDMHSVCRVSCEPCPPDSRADLAWQSVDSILSTIHLQEVLWEEPFADHALFLHSQHLLDQLFSHKLCAYLQIHAATLLGPSGLAYLISGESASGKTCFTLTALLRNWRWLSDEFALFGRESGNTVFAFPRNFNIKEHSFDLFPETLGLRHGREVYSSRRRCAIRFVDPEVLSPKSHVAQAPVGCLIFPFYSPAEKTTRIEKIPPRKAAESLLASAVHLPPWGPGFLMELCLSMPAYEIYYSNPREVELPGGR